MGRRRRSQAPHSTSSSHPYRLPDQADKSSETPRSGSPSHPSNETEGPRLSSEPTRIHDLWIPDRGPDMILYMPPGFLEFLMRNSWEYMRLLRWYSMCHIVVSRRRRAFAGKEVDALEVFGSPFNVNVADWLMHLLVRFWCVEVFGEDNYPSFPSPLPGGIIHPGRRERPHAQ